MRTDHVRVERVGLEHHGEPALGRGHLVDRLAVDAARSPPVICLEPGDHAQQRGLAAAGRADEDHELAVVDLEVDAVDDLDRAEALDDALRSSSSAIRRLLPLMVAIQPS